MGDYQANKMIIIQSCQPAGRSVQAVAYCSVDGVRRCHHAVRQASSTRAAAQVSRPSRTATIVDPYPCVNVGIVDERGTQLASVMPASIKGQPAGQPGRRGQLRDSENTALCHLSRVLSSAWSSAPFSVVFWSVSGVTTATQVSRPAGSTWAAAQVVPSPVLGPVPYWDQSRIGTPCRPASRVDAGSRRSRYP